MYECAKRIYKSFPCSSLPFSTATPHTLGIMSVIWHTEWMGKWAAPHLKYIHLIDFENFPKIAATHRGVQWSIVLFIQYMYYIYILAVARFVFVFVSVRCGTIGQWPSSIKHHHHYHGHTRSNHTNTHTRTRAYIFLFASSHIQYTSNI